MHHLCRHMTSANGHCRYVWCRLVHLLSPIIAEFRQNMAIFESKDSVRSLQANDPVQHCKAVHVDRACASGPSAASWQEECVLL
jgi:hypothetical protein